MKGRIVYIIGPDGAGKTTLANGLREILKKCGIKACISYIRGTHTIASIVARIMSKFSVFHGSDNPIYDIKIPRRMLKLWQVLEFISVLPIYIIRFSIKSRFYDIILGDRSPLDTLVWIVLTTKQASFVNTFMGRFLLALFLRPSLCFYVIADLHVLQKRKNDMDEEFLRREVRVYNTVVKVITKYKNIVVIDTTKTSVQDNLDIIANIVIDYAKQIR